MATVIDIDHWRHVYLLFGIWGAIAADRSDRQIRMDAARENARRLRVDLRPTRCPTLMLTRL